MSAVPGEYVLITPVWGDAYVERFVKLSLPSQLSNGNIPAMPRERTRYRIYTNDRHSDAIRRSPAFRALDELIPVSIESLDDLPDPRLLQGPFELMNAAYGRAIRAGRDRNAAFLFLTPDLLLADGSLRRLVDLCERERKRVVMVASVRMTTDAAYSCVDSHRDGPASSIPPRQLVSCCLDDMHPISMGHIVGEHGAKAAEHFYWPVGDSGLLIHAFHQHPLLVWPSNPDAAIRTSVDDDYIARACPNSEDRYIVIDSDEVCLTEFSTREHGLGMLAAKPMSWEQLSVFMVYRTNQAHRELVTIPIHFHSRSLDSEWDAARRTACRFLDVLFTRFQESQAAPKRPSFVCRIRGRLARFVPTAVNPFAEPVRFIYRILAFPLYRYLDRLNAQILESRNEIAVLREAQSRWEKVELQDRADTR